jgi:hypothetical protein
MQRGLLLLAFVSLASCAESAHAGDIVDLLHPGSRASIALGGDPFASPLDPGGGLWPEADVFRAPALRLDAAASDPLGRGSPGVAGELSGSMAASRLVLPRVLNGRAYAFTAELASPRWNGSWSGPSGSVSLGGPESRMALEAFAPDVIPGLSMQARLPLGTTAGEPGASRTSAALQYRRPALSLQGHWSLQRRPEPLHSDLYDQFISAPLNLRSERFGLDGRIAPGPLWEAEGSFARVYDRPLEAVDGTAGYRIAPGGAGRIGQASFSLGPAPRRLLARWTERTRDLNGRAYLDGDLFARLNYGRIWLRSWLFAAQLGSASRTRGVMEFELAQAVLNARGEVESWPFTSGLVALLGVRRVGYATAAAQWSRWHAGLECHPRSWLGVSGGLNAYDIRPTGTLESWQPILFVLGRTDDRVDRLTIERAQLGAISLGGRLVAGRAEVQIGVRQFVAAHIQRSSAAGALATGASPAPGLSPAPSPSPARWPGGTLADFSITMWF